MSPTRLLSVVSLGFAAAAFVAGCSHVPKGSDASSAQDGWQWELPSPPPPPMAWVAAGPFRVEERTVDSVDAIIIHTTEGRFVEDQSMEENYQRAFLGNINYFKGNDRNVSAHYVVGHKGDICWMVDEGHTAHTQTYYNSRGFGIECAGWGRFPETWTPERMDALVDLCAYLCVKWEIPPYQPEGTAYEGPYSVQNGEDEYRFTAPGLVGHYQVQPWNKSDPGPHFDWEGFCKRVEARIIEYGHEPIPLPPGTPPLPVGQSVTAEIVGETVTIDQPFVYRLTIVAPRAESLGEDDITFPTLNNVSYATRTEGPQRIAVAPGRAVYEFSAVSTEARTFTIIPPKVRLNDNWYDPGTIRVTVQEAEAAIVAASP